MPKMKTNRAAAKRFKRTGSGKLRAQNAFRSHLLEKKTAKRKRRLRKGFILSASDVQRIKTMIPY